MRGRLNAAEKGSRTGQQPAAVGGNLEDRGDTREHTKPIQNQSKLRTPVNTQNQTRVKRTPLSIPCILNDTIAALVAVALLMTFLKTFLF